MSTVHFIGICGTAMATLAALLKHKGFDVRGSDQNVYPPMSDFLAREKIRALSGYRPEHITRDIDLVVVGNAISRGNPELEEVLDRKIRFLSLPETLREHFLWGARSIVIAGTHGKTTTTSLVGWLLTEGGLDPTVFVGGIAANFGEEGSSYRVGAGRDFVIEGDEYDSAFFDKTAKFLKYLPDIVVVNNVEFDHADIYPDLQSIRTAFRRLVTLIPRNGLLVVGTDDPEAVALTEGARCHVQSAGLSEGATWRVIDAAPVPDGMTFQVSREGRLFGSFQIPLMGLHNVRNTVAAIAVGASRGLDAEILARGTRTFRGVKRRLEVVGRANGVTVFDDFAHHPTAVAETLAALRAGHPASRIWAVFEPRSASSCRRVFQPAFAGAFRAADRIVIAAVYRSSLPESERLSAEELVADLRRTGADARHIPEVDDIVSTITRERQPGDLVVFMSNGGFGGIHRRMLAALEDAARSKGTVPLLGFGQRLREAFGAGRVREHSSLAPFTTFKVGGPADWLLEVTSADELLRALELAREAGVPVTLLGGGSNVLISDRGIPGLVVRTRGGRVEQLAVASGFSRTDAAGASMTLVRVDAGVTINALVRWTINRGLAGLEAWAGTPGTIGGGICGNAHYGGRLLGELVDHARLVSRDGRVRDVPASEMEFAYDRSRLQHTGELLLWAVIRLTPGADSSQLRAIARQSLAYRKRTQPLETPSAGCIFQNPDPATDPLPAGIPPSAGALVDRAGLKGRSVGGATVSTTHGNFIVNRGGATATEIRVLIESCQKAVHDAFGVTLREEIVYLGSFED